jgi:hypothetical protein
MPHTAAHPAGPIFPNRGVRRVPQRLGGSATPRSKTQQIRNKIITYCRWYWLVPLNR